MAKPKLHSPSTILVRGSLYELLGLHVGDGGRALRREMLVIPGDRTLHGVDLVFGFREPVTFAGITQEDGFGANVFQRDKELLRFGDGDIVVVFAVHDQRGRVRGGYVLQG
jgi:hypothetical protein